MKVVGDYHALWILVPVEKEEIKEILKSHPPVSLEEKQNIVFGEGSYFLWWELGIQRDCGPSWSSWFRSSFHEAKCTVPFVFHPDRGNEKLLNIKERVFLDNYVNSLGSRFLHNLDTPCVSITFTDNQYSFSYQGKQLHVDYQVSIYKIRYDNL